MADSLDQAIHRYKQAIEPLSNEELSESQVLEILIARDGVQAVLVDKTQWTGTDCAIVAELDHRLRQNAARLSSYTDSEEWRSSYHPTETAWWWFLKNPHLKKSDRFDWLWGAVSIACLTISLSLVGDISARFLTGGSDTFGAFAISTQSILTLLTAGGALTKAGQEANKRMLKRFNISETYWHEVGAAFSILLVVSLLGARLSLPWIATKYTTWGRHQFEQKKWGSAEATFKRALHLNADNSEAHFWLGRLYEELQAPKEARPHYQLAAEDGNLEASNNLARLYILDKNYSAAIALLNQALDKDYSPATARHGPALDHQQPSAIAPDTKQALLKNFGWARFLQGDLAGAESKLREAIDVQDTAKLDKNIAAPHCLLAQVLEANKESAKARSHWELCNQNATIYNPDEDQWAIWAQQKLKGGQK
jgi:Flp pilus assembly protein TadD